MLGRLYAKWMYAWETALTMRDVNRVERPLEWGFEHLASCADGESLRVEGEGLWGGEKRTFGYVIGRASRSTVAE